MPHATEKRNPGSSTPRPEEHLSNVTPSRPCVVCDKGKRCTYGDGGLIFCRYKTGDVPGFKFIKVSDTDKSASQYRHVDDNPSSTAPSRNGTPTPPPRRGNFNTLFEAKAKSLTAERLADFASTLGLPADAVGTLKVGVYAARSGGRNDYCIAEQLPHDGDICGLAIRLHAPNEDGATKTFEPGGVRGLTYSVGWRGRRGHGVIVEGATCVAACAAMGLAGIGRPNVNSKPELLIEEFRDWPVDRDIVLLMENDHKPDGTCPGHDLTPPFAAPVAKGLGRRVYVAAVPDGAKDVRDWLKEAEADSSETFDYLAAGTRFLESLKLVAIDPPAPKVEHDLSDVAAAVPVTSSADAPPALPVRAGEGVSPASSLCRVALGVDEHRVNDQVVAALAGDPEIFQRAGELVRVIEEPARGGLLPRPARVTISPIPEPTLRELMTSRVRFMQVHTSEGGDVKGESETNPPLWCVKAVHARKVFGGVRLLDSVVEHPVVRADGTVLAANGYDPSTGLYLRFNSSLPVEVPDVISDIERIEAREKLLDVIVDFPFTRDCYKGAWLAGLLTPLARFAFAGPAPLFMFDANTPGTGKGLAAAAMFLIVTGRSPSVMTYAHDTDEMNKQITTIARYGDRLVFLDNVEGTFGNTALCGALSSDRWKGRLLGSSEFIDFPLSATWYATGNNVKLGRDMPRRVVQIRMESTDERPEDRTNFKHPLLRNHVAANRGELLGAALTLLAGYLRECGRGDCRIGESLRWGDYTEWCRVVRGCVIWSGLPDPLEAKEELRHVLNPVEEAIGVLMSNWHVFKSRNGGLTASEIVRQVFPQEGERTDTDGPWVALAEAIDVLAHDRSGRSLGNRLREFRKRRIEGKFLDYRKSDGCGKWYVCGGSEIPE